MEHKLLLVTFCFLFCITTSAQNHNPYRDIGKQGKVITLTGGKYDEAFDEDSIQQIGSALINIHTMQLVKLKLTPEEQRQFDNSSSARFLSVDPLTKKYSWLTPYQFAGNTPIQSIDLDGAEPIKVIMGFGGITFDKPKITKSSQWYVYLVANSTSSSDPFTIMVDEKTFNSAAQYNSANLNYQFYSSFDDKKQYYDWAQLQVDKKGIKSKWFSMDATIVGPTEVGLTDLDIINYLSPSTHQFLNNIGDIVLEENMKVYNQLNTKGSFNGKTSGASLDQELLYNEQTKIQDYMSKQDSKSLSKYLGEYNSGFKLFQKFKGSDHYLNTASSIIGGNIDFGNLEHRLIIGEVLLYQKYSLKIDDTARSQIINIAKEGVSRYNKEKTKQ